MYYRARWYDPNLGRFISEDPIGFGGGDINLYGYVWDSPQSFSDPLGFQGAIRFYPAGGSYEQSQEDDIRRAIDSIRLNEKCRKSFTDAGLRDPYYTDINVGPAKTLNYSGNPDVARDLGLTPNGAFAGRQGLASASAATTVSNNRYWLSPDLDPSLRYTLDENPRIFYKDTSFGDNQNFVYYYVYGYWKLKEVTGHELIHAMGQPGIPPPWYMPWRHDLTAYPYYNKIMSDCGCFN